MVGCFSDQANGHLLAFLVTHGVVITHLADAEREALASHQAATTFQAGKHLEPPPPVGIPSKSHHCGAGGRAGARRLATRPLRLPPGHARPRAVRLGW